MENVIIVPENVDVTICGKEVTVKGIKGQLKRNFSDPRFNKQTIIEKNGDTVIVKSESNKRKTKAVVGTILAHIKNMIIGVTQGYVYKMKIFYTHFPITLEVKGNKIFVKNFLGEKSSRMAKIVGKTTLQINKDVILLKDISKEDAGQTAANIEMCCRLSGKDRRIFLDGIYITGYGIGEEQTV